MDRCTSRTGLGSVDLTVDFTVDLTVDLPSVVGAVHLPVGRGDDCGLSVDDRKGDGEEDEKKKKKKDREGEEPPDGHSGGCSRRMTE